MATLPAVRSTRALTFGLGLVGVLLLTPPLESVPAAVGTLSIAADDPGQPPPPGPAVGSAGPGDQGPAQGVPRPHRRHIDNDPALRR